MRTIKEILKESECDDLTELLMKCRLSFRFFCDYVLSNTFHPIRLKDFHVEWFNMFRQFPRSCVAAFRGSGKTFTLGVAMPLWVQMFERQQEMLIVSRSMEQSTAILAQIRAYIEENELLRSLKPTDEHAVWSKTQINTSTGGKIVCRPYTESVRGGHYNYALIDEISTYPDPQLYWNAVVPTVNAKKGHIMAIGTPLSEFDLLAQLKKNKEYRYAEYPALKKDGTPLWPERFSIEDLKKIEAENPVAFAREYLLVITDSHITPFPFNLIVKAYDRNKQFLPKRPANDDSKYFVGVDLASSPEGDYTVITTVKRNDDGTIELVDMKRFRGMFVQAQLEEIKAVNQKFQPLKVLIDESQFGKMMIQQLFDWNVPVEGYQFTRAKRMELFKNLIFLFQSRSVILPYSDLDPETVAMVDILTKELTSVVPEVTASGQETYVAMSKHDDCVISLGLACKAAVEEKGFLPVILKQGRVSIE